MSKTVDPGSEGYVPTVRHQSDMNRGLLPETTSEESFDVGLDSGDQLSDTDSSAGEDQRQGEPGRRSKRACVAWASCLLLLLIILIRHYYEGICEGIFTFFAFVKQFREPFRSGMFWLSSFVVQIMSIPIACIVTVVISYCYSSYWGGYALSLSVCLAVNLVMIKVLDRQRSANQRPAQSDKSSASARAFSDFLVKTIDTAMMRHPYLACGLVRSLHLPDGAKVYILTRFKLKLLEYLLPMLVVESLNVFLYSFVGYQIKDRFDLINPKTFSNKSLSQKISTISIYVLLVLQGLVLLSGLCFTYLKYREYKKTLAQGSPAGRFTASPVRRRAAAQ